MADVDDKVVTFPIERRMAVRGCPQCGIQQNVWRIGRLLWGYCDRHELRWVVADRHDREPEPIDRGELRRRLEFLARFVEVSR